MIPTIRTAVPDDAPRISAVLKASITQLCADDHGNKAEHLRSWLANKSPDHILKWITSGYPVFVSLADQDIAATGSFDGGNEITLLYVAPEFRGQGHSTALLDHLERAIAALGHPEAVLTSSRTAQAFYESRGWTLRGERVACYSTDGQPMAKSLKAAE